MRTLALVQEFIQKRIEQGQKDLKSENELLYRTINEGILYAMIETPEVLSRRTEKLPLLDWNFSDQQ